MRAGFLRFPAHAVASAFLSLLAIPTLARAQTITFDALPGANGSAFTTYSEPGFVVDLFAGFICIAKSVGNPVPDLFGGPVCNQANPSSVLRIRRTGGGVFGFAGTDLAAQIGAGNYVFTGSLSAAQQYADAGTVPGNPAANPQTLASYSGAHPGTAIDELRISLTAGGTSYNIDNIALGSVTATPEPATFVLVGTGFIGLIGFGATRRPRLTYDYFATSGARSVATITASPSPAAGSASEDDVASSRRMRGPVYAPTRCSYRCY